MPRFQPKRYEQILAQMIAKVVARSELSDVGDASVYKHILAASARQDDEQYHQAALLLQLFNLDNCKGVDLDERAAEIQPAVVSRDLGVLAVTLLVFSRPTTTGTQLIQTGSRIRTDTGIIFRTTAPGVITAASAQQIAGHGTGRDSAPVPAIAEQVGIAGNVAANSLTKFTTSPVGINEVTNPSRASKGEDWEEDDPFRARLRAYIRGLARCQVQAVEAGLLGQRDPVSGARIRYSRVIEDVVVRGNFIAYIDDGTGQVEAVAAAYTTTQDSTSWDATTTVTCPNTTGISVDDWIGFGSGLLFQVSVVTPNTSVTILNPGSDSIPTGSGVGRVALDVLTAGFDIGDVAFGGELRLKLDNKPIKEDLPFLLASSVSGNLTQGVDYTLDPASGLVVLTTPLAAGEQVAASYTYYTGLIAYAQKIIDGDKADRQNFPGLRAGGVLARVRTPQVLIQAISYTVTVAEGYLIDSVMVSVDQALMDHVNTLGISDDLIRAKLISVAMAVPGVVNFNLLGPAHDVIVLDDQLIRTTLANISGN